MEAVRPDGRGVEEVEAVRPDGRGVEEVIGDKDVTAMRRWSRLMSGFGAICRTRIAGDAAGRTRRRGRRRREACRAAGLARIIHEGS